MKRERGELIFGFLVWHKVDHINLPEPAEDNETSMLTRRAWRAIAVSLLLFALNAWICRELFTADFVNNLLSNEGIFAALGRFFREHPLDHRWFPWFNVGMATEYAYQPLLPTLAAVTGAMTGWPPSRALHAVLGFAYCCGPVTLFWLAWEWSASMALSVSAALAFSLASPAEWLIRELRIGSGAHWGALRLNNMVYYGEAPHNVALAMLPLAFLFLHRAIVRGGAWNMVLAGAMSGAVALTNAFGTFGVALGAFSMVLALERGVKRVLIVGVCSYCWVSPWLPPSLILWIRRTAWSAEGFFQANTRAYLAIPGCIAAFAVVWFLTRRMKGSFERFACLFGVWMCAIALGYFWLHLTIVPQSGRYMLEFEMALCLLMGCIFLWIWRRLPSRGHIALVLIVAGLGVRQLVIYRQFASPLVRPIDITKTIEYRAVTWIDRNLPGERAMLSGDPEYIFNLYSDNPQMSAGHEPTAPNWMQRVAVFTIYTGMNAGDRDAEYSIFWLKAFGNQAIYVPGAASREHYHPIVHSHKFDGLLPVLWHAEDDTIFRIPQRTLSLAHVIPQSAVVTRKPIHGLDTEPARAYVAALDDTALPLADLTWLSPSRGTISTAMNRDQVLSVQETWMPGWEARVGGRRVPVRGDQLGLIVIEPGCDGLCRVDLSFGLTTEGWICRAVSAVVTLLALVALFRNKRLRTAR
jgi:hypothetical protein